MIYLRRKFLLPVLILFLGSVQVFAQYNTLLFVPTSKDSGTLSGEPDGVIATFSNTLIGPSATGQKIESGNVMTLTLSGFSTSTNIKSLSLDLSRNSNSGAGSVMMSIGQSVVCSYAISKESITSDYKTYSIPIVEHKATDDVVITISASENSLYCRKFSIEYAINEDTSDSRLIPSFSYSATDVEVNIEEQASFVSPILTNESDGELTFSSSNTDVATIDGDGEVTIVGKGVTTITASAGETENYQAASASYILNVVGGFEFSESFTNAVYGGGSTINADNTGWGYSNSTIPDVKSFIRIGDNTNKGTLTTPVLTDLPTHTVMTFQAEAYKEGETSVLTLSGTDCSLSETSFETMGGVFKSFVVGITKTGSNPQITFSAQAGKQINLDNVNIMKGDAVVISNAKYASYCSSYTLDFSSTGITVFTAKGNGESVRLTEVTDGIVPAGTGVVLYSATAGSFAVPTTTTEKMTLEDNELVGITEATNVAAVDGNYTNYILSNEASGVGFYKAAAGGATLRANRAYLHTQNGSSARYLTMNGQDGMGVSTVETAATAPQTIYNLNGQRMTRLQRGLNIVGGVKIFTK